MGSSYFEIKSLMTPTQFTHFQFQLIGNPLQSHWTSPRTPFAILFKWEITLYIKILLLKILMYQYVIVWPMLRAFYNMKPDPG